MTCHHPNTKNQITYIIDHRFLEPPDKKPNYIKWSETLAASTKEKSIHCRRIYNPRTSD